MKLRNVTSGLVLTTTALAGIATAEPVAAPPPTKSAKPFAYVLDDQKQSTASFVGDDIFIIENNRIAHYTPDHPLDWKTYSAGLAKFIKTHDGFVFTRVFGTTLDNLWLQADHFARMGSTSAYLRFTPNGGWQDPWPEKPTLRIDMKLVQATQTGAIGQWGPTSDGTGIANPDNTDAPKNGHWLVSTPGLMAPFETKGFTALQIKQFPSAETWIFGSQCKPVPKVKDGQDLPPPDCALQVRRWIPTGVAIVTDAIPGDPQAVGNMPLVALSPTDAVLQLPNGLLHFDGTKWSPMQWKGKAKNSPLHASPDGKLWTSATIGQHVVIERRSANGSIEDVSCPTDPTSDLYGVEQGAPWMVLNDDNVAHWDEASKKWITWRIPRPSKDPAKTMSLPRATDIRVHGPNDVWISVSYDELNPKDPSAGPGAMGYTSFGALLHLSDPSGLK